MGLGEVQPADPDFTNDGDEGDAVNDLDFRQLEANLVAGAAERDRLRAGIATEDDRLLSRVK